MAITFHDRKGKPYKIIITTPEKSNALIVYYNPKEGVRLAWNIQTKNFPHIIVALNFIIRKLEKEYCAELAEKKDFIEFEKELKQLKQDYIG